MVSKLKLFNQQNLFLILLVMMVFLGKFLPYEDSWQKIFDLNAFINWGIAAIFLLYGLKLNIGEVKKDLANWRIHLIIQCATFILFPFLVFIFYGFSSGTEYYSLWLSIFFLASLPSTVSSSVVMVSIAKGNVTSAIFNASISGIIGIVVTPLLMGFFLKNNGENSGDQSQIFYQLLLKVLLPIILGLILNPFFKNFVQKYSNVISQFDKLIILLIVYQSFSEAFLQHVFTSVPAQLFVILLISVITLFFAVFGILEFVSNKMNLSRADKITVKFCGSKKSLVHGSLFVLILGIPDNQKVLFLLPVMVFHSFQLFYVSFYANKIAKLA